MAIRQHGLFTKCIPGYQNAKQACYIYGYNEEGIDTGCHIEGEGVLFLSKIAVREMGEVLGFSFNEDGQKLEEENAHLTYQNQLLQGQVEQLQADLDSFGRAIARARNDPEQTPTDDSPSRWRR